MSIELRPIHALFVVFVVLLLLMSRQHAFAQEAVEEVTIIDLSLKTISCGTAIWTLVNVFKHALSTEDVGFRGGVAHPFLALQGFGLDCIATGYGSPVARETVESLEKFACANNVILSGSEISDFFTEESHEITAQQAAQKATGVMATLVGCGMALPH
jgi:hypothetical protein